MRDLPILFSAPMVRALLAGTKTQTRRLVKPQPTHFNPAGVPRQAKPEGASDVIRCPYGVPGDRLWVRETFFAFGRWETRFSAEKGRDEWHFVDMTLETGRAYLYKAPEGWQRRQRAAGGAMPSWWKRPAIHMPRAASRITLEVTGVRVERLQEISEADAIAEGVERTVMGDGWRRYADEASELAGLAPCASARDSYRSLWEQINGAGSWEANPWAWVVEFRRADQ